MLNFNQFRRFITVFATVLLISEFCGAQQRAAFSDETTDLPEVVFYPNPAKANNSVFIKLAEMGTENHESETFSVKISDERGQVLFSAELPDELEFTPSSDRFPKGNYFLQYYQNGRLFQTEELRIE